MLENHKYDELLKEMKEKLENGLNREEILNELEQKKVSIVDAIKITKDLFTESLSQAREILTQHPIWQQITYEYDEFHKKMFDEMLDNFSNHKVDESKELEDK